MANKYYAYLLNVEQSNLLFGKIVIKKFTESS